MKGNSESSPQGNSKRRKVKTKKALGQKEAVNSMLFEDPNMFRSLQKIVGGFTSDTALQQDLLQECLLRLWKIEHNERGRTMSWYLQNCRFHIQHFLASGKSLDSLKRANGEKRISIHRADAEDVLEGYDTNGEVFDAISFQDTINTLASRLKPAERAILRDLADGFMLREIASRVGLSY